MAVLTEAERRRAWAEFMYDRLNSDGTLSTLLKTDIKAAVDAIDDFLNGNMSGLNNALPEPAKSVLTVKQKALLLMYVVGRRYNVEV